jgi:hypothetical protein
MTHQHQCRLCNQRFECQRITHCKLQSFDRDRSKRPICPSCFKKAELAKFPERAAGI